MTTRCNKLLWILNIVYNNRCSRWETRLTTNHPLHLLFIWKLLLNRSLKWLLKGVSEQQQKQQTRSRTEKKPTCGSSSGISCISVCVLSSNCITSLQSCINCQPQNTHNGQTNVQSYNDCSPAQRGPANHTPGPWFSSSISPRAIYLGIAGTGLF